MIDLAVLPTTRNKDNSEASGSKGKGKDAEIMPRDAKKSVPKATTLKALTKPLVSKKTIALLKPLGSPGKQLPKKFTAGKTEKFPRPKPKSVERDPRLQFSRIIPSNGVSAPRISRIPKRSKDPRASSSITGLSNSILALKKLDTELSKAFKNTAKGELEDGKKTIIIGGNSIKLTNESAVRSKLLEDARILGALKRRISDLNAHNLAMEKKLKEQGKSKAPIATPVVPSSLEVRWLTYIRQICI